MNERIIARVLNPIRCIVLAAAVLCCVGSAAAVEVQPGKPDLPDLNVCTISRLPRYPGYVLKYQPVEGSQGEWMPFVADPETGEAITDEAKIKAIKRWPDEGEEVTFRALVANHGTQPTGPFKYTWYIDGLPVEQGTHDSLDGPALFTDEWEETDIAGLPFKLAKRVEGTTCFLEMKWAWRNGRHYVRLDLDGDDAITEICEVNNDLMDATNACSFVMVTDAYTYNTLAEVENHWKSYNFDDILKYHRAQMHRKFKASVSEFAPFGILEEIRIDVLYVQAEGEERDRIATVKLKGGWDSHWDFTGYAKRDDPEHKYWFATSQDWGLPHELGHQLGLIDYYCLDTEGGDGGNLVTDANGDPILLSHFTGMIGMMRGHGDVRYSEVSAAALNSQIGRRRGYFGDYLWALPAQNTLRLLDFDGKPVPGAKLRIFQHKGRFVDPTVIYEGATDENGEYALKNRDCFRFKTDRGYEIKPNPWGQINVVGTNGVFFIEVTARNCTDYAWIEITRMNVEYLRGNTERATYDIPTIIPGANATSAPDVKTVQDADGQMKLVWQPIGTGETYAVYQRVNQPPRWAVVEGAEALTQTEFKPRVNGNGRFVVIAAAQGRLSAPSREQRIVNLANPMGLTLDDDGRRIVLDSGHYMPIMFRPDNSAIGIFGTFHMGLGGPGDITRTKDGTLVVTTSSRAPIRLLDARGHFLPRTNVGEFGDGEMQFKDPTGVTVDSAGRIWICDTGHGRIQILDEKLEKVLAVAGAEQGLKAPTKVAEIAGGRLFAIADPEAGRVTLVKFDGESFTLGKSLKVARPVYVTATDKYLYVSDEGSDPQAPGQVLSFRIEGESLKPSGTYSKDILKPYGLAVDAKRNVLVVVDRTAKRLVNVPLS